MNWPNCDSHLSRHRLKEFCRHGEAGSVDIEAVNKEQAFIRELWPDFSQKITGMLMNLPYLHSLHPIVGFHRGKCMGNKQAGFKLHFALPVMQTAHTKETFSSLGSQ